MNLGDQINPKNNVFGNLQSGKQIKNFIDLYLFFASFQTFDCALSRCDEQVFTYLHLSTEDKCIFSLYHPFR